MWFYRKRGTRPETAQCGLEFPKRVFSNAEYGVWQAVLPGAAEPQPDLFIFFTLASVASIDAANSRIAFASRSAASLAS